jgi:hypothetical protein
MTQNTENFPIFASLPFAAVALTLQSDGLRGALQMLM